MQQFETEHQKAYTGESIPQDGYPDKGNNRFSEKLPYAQWYHFNNVIRTRYNFLEQLTPILVWTFINCLYQPLASAIICFVFFIGRIAYTAGYAKSPTYRAVGALTCDIAFLSQFILSLVTIAVIGKDV